MRNLDRARLNIRNGDVSNINIALKLSMFDIYNKLDKLSEKELFKRAKVYSDYYKLTGKYPYLGHVNYLLSIDINEFRNLGNNYELEVLEYVFKLKTERLYISNVDVLNNQPDEVIKSVIDFTNTDGIDLDIKVAYRYLESIRKQVRTHAKVAGYLKELRIKHGNSTKTH